MVKFQKFIVYRPTLVTIQMRTNFFFPICRSSVTPESQRSSPPASHPSSSFMWTKQLFILQCSIPFPVLHAFIRIESIRSDQQQAMRIMMGEGGRGLASESPVGEGRDEWALERREKRERMEEGKKGTKGLGGLLLCSPLPDPLVLVMSACCWPPFASGSHG